MTAILNIFIFPILMMVIAVVLLCFYLHIRKKRAVSDVTIPTTQDGNTSSVHFSTVSLPEDQAGEDRHYDRFPPRYSTVDLPPPYSLFDPKLTHAWPGGPPPAYEMYPITLPLAPHHWMTPSEPPTPPSSLSTHNNPWPQRLRQPSAI